MVGISHTQHFLLCCKVGRRKASLLQDREMNQRSQKLQLRVMEVDDKREDEISRLDSEVKCEATDGSVTFHSLISSQCNLRVQDQTKTDLLVHVFHRGLNMSLIF